MKFISFIIQLGLFISFMAYTSYSQNEANTPAKVSGNLTDLPESSMYSIIYSKKSVPNKDSFLKNFNQDGNNFFGISASPIIRLNKNFSIKSEIRFQYGNINGIKAFNTLLIPQLVIDLDFINFGFGSGFSVLTTDSNEAELGGTGMIASFFINSYIYKGFSLGFDIGFENYGQANYNSISLGINYTINP